MAYQALIFGGMICDMESGLPIGGAKCQIIGSYGHTTNIDTSDSSDGDFTCTNPGAEPNAFWAAKSTSDDPTELLYLFAYTTGYEAITDRYVGDVWNHEEGETYWTRPLKTGAPGPAPQSYEDLGLNFQTEPLKLEPMSGAPAVAWVGEWESAHDPSQQPSVFVTIMHGLGQGPSPVYTIDITDRIFGDTVHEETVGYTLGRVVPSKLRLESRRAPRAARALPGIHFLRTSVRAVRATPIGAAGAIQNVLPDLSKVQNSKVAFVEVGKFAAKLGVLCDSLRLSNGIVLQLYGLYTAQGHNLVDYSIRYRREGIPAPKAAAESVTAKGLGAQPVALALPLKLDFMLNRYIEPPK